MGGLPTTGLSVELRLSLLPQDKHQLCFDLRLVCCRVSCHHILLLCQLPQCLTIECG
jgi:hypothetical protein